MGLTYCYLASHSIGSKYISNERQDALQKRIQRACKMATPHPSFPVGLTYSSLAIHDDRYASNEIECLAHELELELIQTQMAQKPMLRAEVGMRVRCANKASAE